MKILDLLEADEDPFAEPESKELANFNPSAEVAYRVIMAANSQKYLPDKFKKALMIVMKDPFYAGYYAQYNLHRRWQAAERYIAKDARSSFKYAKYVIKGRFLRGEPAIIKEPNFATAYYGLFIAPKPWPEAGII